MAKVGYQGSSSVAALAGPRFDRQSAVFRQLRRPAAHTERRSVSVYNLFGHGAIISTRHGSRSPCKLQNATTDIRATGEDATFIALNPVRSFTDVDPADCCARIEAAFRQPDVLNGPLDTLPPPITAIRCSKLVGPTTNLDRITAKGRLLPSCRSAFQGAGGRNPPGRRPPPNRCTACGTLPPNTDTTNAHQARSKTDLAPCAPDSESCLLCKRVRSKSGLATGQYRPDQRHFHRPAPGMELLRVGHSAVDPDRTKNSRPPLTEAQSMEHGCGPPISRSKISALASTLVGHHHWEPTSGSSVSTSSLVVEKLSGYLGLVTALKPLPIGERWPRLFRTTRSSGY